MKKANLALLALVLISSGALADETVVATQSLEDQLQGLAIPANQLPIPGSSEKMYVIQNRYNPLGMRSELALGVGKNFTNDSFLVSNEVSLAYRFFLSDRWNLGLAGSYVFNDFTDTAAQLKKSEGRIPDAAFAKSKADLSLGYNLFYGKFRLSMDQVFYFDQYIALGAGLVQQSKATTPAGTFDIGFAFWFGKNLSARLGGKSWIYNEKRSASSATHNNLIGHFDLGYLFGSGGETL